MVKIRTINSFIAFIIFVFQLFANTTCAQKGTPENNSLKCFERQLKVDGISKDTLMLIRSEYQKAVNDFDLDVLECLTSQTDSILKYGGYIKDGYMMPKKWATCLDSASKIAKCKKGNKDHFCHLKLFLNNWVDQDSFYREFTPMTKAGGIKVLISEFGMRHELYELYYFTMMVAATTKPE